MLKRYAPRMTPRARRMKWLRVFAAITIVWLIACVVIAYAFRVRIKEAVVRWTAPALPIAEPYRSPSVQAPTPVPSHPVAPTASTDAAFPAEKQLAVPFLSQAPLMQWDAVHEETCEEASVLMVRAYYAGQTGLIDPNAGERALQEAVAFQNAHYGFFQDTSATETKRFLEALYPELTATVVPLQNADQIKRYVARGIPVIVPADGKALPNPNFRNGGPVYHMLVVRGYTADQFITNDPGTRNGENFLYALDDLTRAAHDWNGGDVPDGAPVLLIITPK